MDDPSRDPTEVYDPQFETAGRKSGLQIWRIEDFALNPIDESQFGSFYSGDAYIVLKTTLTKSNRKEYNLHFWLGKDSSQDEQGTAAILSVQLDDYLNGDPVQYREVENHETPIFKSYFKAGIIYKEGGVASGFNHVKTNDFSDVKRLLHVKGKKNVNAREVKFSWDSFNRGDSFIIDIGHLIIVFNAAESNRSEQMKANILAKDIGDRERGGRSRVEIIDGKAILMASSSERLDAMEQYSEILGQLDELFGAPMPKQFAPSTKDDVAGAASFTTCKLFHLSDNTGEFVVKEVATSPLHQKLLLHEDCYLIDQGNGQKIYTWKGKTASKNERKKTMTFAIEYIKKRNYNQACQIEANNDGAESAMFKQLFSKWTEPTTTVGYGQVTTTGKVAKSSNEKFDASTLHSNPAKAAESRMPDNGQGSVVVWRVEGEKLCQIKDKHVGEFYTGDSYILLYTYNKTNKEAHIIYIWQGLKSPATERGKSAALAVLVWGLKFG